MYVRKEDIMDKEGTGEEKDLKTHAEGSVDLNEDSGSSDEETNSDHSEHIGDVVLRPIRIDRARLEVLKSRGETRTVQNKRKTMSTSPLKKQKHKFRVV